MRIPFNKLYKTQETLASIENVKLENGFYTEWLLDFFKKQGFQNPFLTNSCTTALEIIAYVIGIEKSDEVIVPSYGYVSTANTFAMAGAQLVFTDSQPNHPNVTLKEVERRITPKTKAVVLIHYGGMSTELDEIASLCKEKGIFLIEDAAHCIGAALRGKALGTFGDFSALSFHQTKNVHCFNGGLLSVNNVRYLNAIQLFYSKGTDRIAFKNGEIDHYQWTAAGSACDLSELNAGYLYYQLGILGEVNQKRRAIWNKYFTFFSELEKLGKCKIVGSKANAEHEHNAHIFAILLNSLEERKNLQNALNKKGIVALEHYNPLHKSAFGQHYWDGNKLPNAISLYDKLLRLPLFPEMLNEDVELIMETVSTSIGL